MLRKFINKFWKFIPAILITLILAILAWPGLVLAETTVFMYAEPDALTLASHEEARLHLESRQLSTLAIHTSKATLATDLAKLPEDLELLIITSKELGQVLTQLPKLPDIPVIMIMDSEPKDYTAYTIDLGEAWYVLGVIAGQWPQGSLIIGASNSNTGYQANLQALQQGAGKPIPSLALQDLEQLAKPDLTSKLVIVLESSPAVWEKLQQTGQQFMGFCPEPYAKNLVSQQIATPKINLKQLFASILMQNRFGMWHDQAVRLGLSSQVVDIEILKPFDAQATIAKQVQATHKKISKQGLPRANN